jgi:3-deoxy-D-arabino-heptulosonate 7-phosphate (DAHP) synthase class II
MESGTPISRYAEAANGSDADMTTYQPSSHMLWEFSRARKTDGAWQA